MYQTYQKVTRYISLYYYWIDQSYLGIHVWIDVI